MASNRRILNAYVRLDATGRVISGSLVLRQTKPKVGKWIEVQTYECCDNFTTTTTTSTSSTTTTTTVAP